MNSQSFRVLVAEIEPEQCSRLSELFSTWGYDVQKAEDGIETVLIAQAWEPHVIVAAYRLGNMLITEVADRLERSVVHHAIVVLGSGSLSDEQRNDTRFCAYLDNHRDTSRLRQIVQAAAVDVQQSRSKESEQGVSNSLGQVLFEVRFGMTAEEVERLLIQDTLRRLPNKTHAARMLGISLKTLHNKLAEYRVKKG
jgi:DNA-binding NtrC family response regulator